MTYLENQDQEIKATVARLKVQRRKEIQNFAKCEKLGMFNQRAKDAIKAIDSFLIEFGA